MTEYYSDFTNNMDLHPATHDLFKVKNIRAVKNAVRNILKTDKYERPFEPDFGCNIRGLLFENNTSDTRNMAKLMIKNALTKYEPRINNLEVEVTSITDENKFLINLSYNIININEKQTDTIPLIQRVR